MLSLIINDSRFLNAKLWAGTKNSFIYFLRYEELSNNKKLTGLAEIELF
jgi:hypothetical protein